MIERAVINDLNDENVIKEIIKELAMNDTG